MHTLRGMASVPVSRAPWHIEIRHQLLELISSEEEETSCLCQVHVSMLSSNHPIYSASMLRSAI